MQSIVETFRMIFMHWFLALFLLVGGSQQPGSTPQQSSETPTVVVAQQWARFSDGYTRHDVDAIASLYTEDARLMISGIDDIVGRLGIKSLFTYAFAQRVRAIDMRMMPREVLGYDGIIFDQGDYIETRAQQNTPRSAFDVYGRYFTVWAQQPDGAWKIARMMLSPKQQPAPR